MNQKNSKRKLITSALPYVNNVPHLGNIIGCVLSADVYHRYCCIRGYENLFICGTDEYGTATEMKALDEGLSCSEICDKYHKLHQEIYQWFNIDFDYFGRTSTPNPKSDSEHLHTKIAHDIFIKLYKNGYIFEQELDQYYCLKCQRFLADRYIIGSCSFCNFEYAKGDQCDACGKLLHGGEMINAKCQKDKSELELRKTKHLFLDLPKLNEKIEKFVSDNCDQWTFNAKQITNGFLKTGLKPRCITRDLEWGTPVPKLEGLEDYENKVLYVWFDAPIGYISITMEYFKSLSLKNDNKNYDNEWKKWWQSDDTEIINFMAKDNVIFHSIIFPGTLIGTDDNYKLVDRIESTEYLMYYGQKFSKSNKIGIFGDDIKEFGLSSYIWRYYLLMKRPENSDADFNLEELETMNNSELCSNLGNCINRLLNIIVKKNSSKIPIRHRKYFNQKDCEYIDKINSLSEEYYELMDKIKLGDGLRKLMQISSLINMYHEEYRYWIIFGNIQKYDEDEIMEIGTKMNLGCNFILHLAKLFQPYMPEFSKKIFDIFDIDYDKIKTVNKFELEIDGNQIIKYNVKLFDKINLDKFKYWKPRRLWYN